MDTVPRSLTRHAALVICVTVVVTYLLVASPASATVAGTFDTSDGIPPVLVNRESHERLLASAGAWFVLTPTEHGANVRRVDGFGRSLWAGSIELPTREDQSSVRVMGDFVYFYSTGGGESRLKRFDLASGVADVGWGPLAFPPAPYVPMAVATDGSVVVSHGNSGFSSTVVRIGATGHLDSAFGDGGSIVTENHDVVSAVAFGAGGKVYVAGAHSGVRRFGQDGKADVSWRGITLQTTDTIVELGDGRVVVAGHYYEIQKSYTHAYRQVTVMESDGAFRVTKRFGPLEGPLDVERIVAVHVAGGEAVLAGSVRSTGGSAVAQVARVVDGSFVFTSQPVPDAHNSLPPDPSATTIALDGRLVRLRVLGSTDVTPPTARIAPTGAAIDRGVRLVFRKRWVPEYDLDDGTGSGVERFGFYQDRFVYFGQPTELSIGKAPTIYLRPGSIECAYMRSQDHVGNSSRSREMCAVSPQSEAVLKQRRGWRMEYNQRAWGLRELVATRSSSTLLVDGKYASSYWLVVTKCPTCGTIEVRSPGIGTKRITLRSSRTLRRVSVQICRYKPATRTAAARGCPGRLALRTIGRGRIAIDGVVSVPFIR